MTSGKGSIVGDHLRGGAPLYCCVLISRWWSVGSFIEVPIPRFGTVCAAGGVDLGVRDVALAGLPVVDVEWVCFWESRRLSPAPTYSAIAGASRSASTTSLPVRDVWLVAPIMETFRPLSEQARRDTIRWMRLRRSSLLCRTITSRWLRESCIVLCTELSYRLVDGPALRLKYRFSRCVRSPPKSTRWLLPRHPSERRAQWRCGAFRDEVLCPASPLGGT